MIRRLVSADTVLMPGVYDALTARIAARVGFEIVFISGYSVSAVRLGEPDFGFLTQTEMVEAARSVCRVSSAPVIVDADTGYGNPLNVIRTVRRASGRGRRGRLPRGSGLAEEMRPFPGQAGRHAARSTPPRSAPPATPAASATSSSSPAPTRASRSGSRRRSSAASPTRRPVPTRSSSRRRSRSRSSSGSPRRCRRRSSRT